MVLETDSKRAAEGLRQSSAELGSSGLRRFGGQIQEEYEPQLRGERGVRVFDEMRRVDPDVGAILTAITMVILSATWNVRPGGETPQDEEAAQFLKSCMGDMSHSWSDFITEVCTMFPFGWAYFEVIFKQRLGPDKDPPSIYDDGRIGWRKIALRGQQSLYRWDLDENGGIRGMVQRAPPDFQERVIPIEKAVLFRTRREKNNPEGYSILRNAYRSYYIRKNLEEIEVIGAERDLTGTLVLYEPAGASQDDHEAALDILRKYKQDDQAGLLLKRLGATPEMQWEAKLLQAAGAGKVDMDKAIQRYSINIARSVLAQFLTLGQGRVGSWALSRDQKDLFHLAVKGHMDTIEDTVNRFLVRKLFSLNDFGQLTELPRIEHSDIGDVDLKTLGSYILALSQAGVMVTDKDATDWLRDKAGLPELPEEAIPPEEAPPKTPPAPVPGETPPSGAVERSDGWTAQQWAQWYLSGSDELE